MEEKKKKVSNTTITRNTAEFSNMTDKVFPFIKNDLTTGKDTAFARYMKDALFMVPSARVLVKVVDALDSLDAIRFSGTKADGWYIENARKAMEAGKIIRSVLPPVSIDTVHSGS